jgi:hypothetical protein
MKIRITDVPVEILGQNNPEYNPEGLISQPSD